MYVLEVAFGGTAEGTFAADTTYIIAASLCDWTIAANTAGDVTDSGFNTTSYTPNPGDADIAVNGDVRTTFPVGTVVSNRADGTNSSIVTEVSYDAGIGSTDITVTPRPTVNWGIASDLYIVSEGSSGYKIEAAKLIMGFNASTGTSTGTANGVFDFTSTNTSSIKLGYIGKTGRFTAITN